MPGYIQEQEPTLFEILHPLVRRWKFLVGGVVISLMIGFAVSFILPKEYDTSMLLQVGSVADKQLEDSYIVAQIINGGAFLQTIASKIGLHASPKKLQKMVKAEIDTMRASSLVTVRVAADRPERAMQLANAVADAVIKRHKPLFDEKLQHHMRYERLLKTRIDQLNQENEDQRKDLELLRPNSENIAAILLLRAKIQEKESEMMNLDRELRDVQIYLYTEVYTRNTKLLIPPVLPVKPAKPNLILNLLVAGLAGVFLMISVILLLEQYEKGSLRS